MEVSKAVIQIMNGISYGLLLFLIASGLSLIFGFMRVINLAHGSYYMLGAYIGIAVFRSTGSFILAAAGSAMIVLAIGIITERVFLNRLYKRELDQVLLTFGFSYIIMDISKWLWGGTPLSLPKPAFLEGSLKILGESFPVYRLALIATGFIIAAVLWILLEKSRIGAVIRAGVDDKDMVSAMGINIKLFFTVVFSFGAFLAAFGGVMGGPVIGAYQGSDSDILVLALAVVVVGGLGTLRGAFIGSIIIGCFETFGKVFFPNYAIMTSYIAMFLILLLKPSGLAGKEEEQ